MVGSEADAAFRTDYLVGFLDQKALRFSVVNRAKVREGEFPGAELLPQIPAAAAPIKGRGGTQKRARGRKRGEREVGRANGRGQYE